MSMSRATVTPHLKKKKKQSRGQNRNTLFFAPVSSSDNCGPAPALPGRLILSEASPPTPLSPTASGEAWRVHQHSTNAIHQHTLSSSLPFLDLVTLPDVLTPESWDPEHHRGIGSVWCGLWLRCTPSLTGPLARSPYPRILPYFTICYRQTGCDKYTLAPPLEIFLSPVMSSNDLLSYSIMHSGDKVLSNASYSHSYTNSAPSHLPLPLPLPLKSIPLTKNKDDEPITLPPISNYCHLLTENNLSRFAPKNVSSSPPSLTSASSIGLVSPVSSPSMTSLKMYKSGSITPDQSQTSSVISSAAVAAAYIQPKRRQRLGPSCDSCRSRKVKCNAEIVVLSRNINIDEDLNPFNLSISQINDLVNLKHPVKIDAYNLIISNNKLIKFKPCESCNARNLLCCFSKGFTKEDIVTNSKKIGSHADSDSDSSCESHDDRKLKLLSPQLSADAKIKKPSKPDFAVVTNSRKLSCASCRKRKVKCVFNDALKKCDGCAKKGHECSFDK